MSAEEREITENADPAKVSEVTMNSVLSRITQMEKTGGLLLPKDYSVENAIRSAWLILQETKTSKTSGEKPVLEACSKSSIASSLLDMAIQGLNPVKNQCYFIAHGNKLTLRRSYMGTIAVAKRFGDVSEVRANAIYEDDEFDFEIDPTTGDKKIIKHKQTLSSLDGEIIGAYAILLLNDGRNYIEIMPMKQIKNSWNRGVGKGTSQTHKEHPEEMAKKTVIGRACKLFINTSSDSVLLDDDDRDDSLDIGITENANKGDKISFDEPIESTYTNISESKKELVDKKETTHKEQNPDKDHFEGYAQLEVEAGF